MGEIKGLWLGALLRGDLGESWLEDLGKFGLAYARLEGLEGFNYGVLLAWNGGYIAGITGKTTGANKGPFLSFTPIS